MSEIKPDIPNLEQVQTGPVFVESDSIAKAIKRNLSVKRIAGHVRRSVRAVKNHGWQMLLRQVDFRFRLATGKSTLMYNSGVPLNRELKAQRDVVYEKMPLISIVVPLYNTPVKFFKQMLKSVEKQSYVNWELILVDGSDRDKKLSGKVLLGRNKQGSFIRYIGLDKNQGISENTNEGLKECRGDYVILLDHDDVLLGNALFEVVKAINKTGADFIYSDEAIASANMKEIEIIHFKPDFAPHTLMGCNYITHLCAFKRSLLELTGYENSGCDGAQDFDLYLRMTEKAKKIHHIPKVLYFWRIHENSTAGGFGQKSYAEIAGEKAINSHIKRLSLNARAEAQSSRPGSYRLRFHLDGKRPLISVVIPNKDYIGDLEKCLKGLYEKAGNVDFETIIVENNSENKETFEFYEKAAKDYPRLKVVSYKGGFNFSAICNLGVSNANGEHIFLLNNDVEFTSGGFLEELLSFSVQPDIGAVSGKLYFPDDTIQHGGIIIGLGGTAGISHKNFLRQDGGYMYRLSTVQDISAVTGACLMVKKSLYHKLGGMDEENFAVAFNDVDFCLRLREMGLWNIFTPYAEAYHYESKSRGYDNEGKAKERFMKEAAALRSRHAVYFEKGDPFYNPNLSYVDQNFKYISVSM